MSGHQFLVLLLGAGVTCGVFLFVAGGLLFLGRRRKSIGLNTLAFLALIPGLLILGGMMTFVAMWMRR